MWLTGGRRLAVATSAIALLASVPAGASATTFGADLNNAPNNPTTCGEGISPYLTAPMGSPSCMYFSGAPGPSSYAPASGTLTAVHVRVGATTGPMQVVILRSLYQNKAGDPGHPYFACCFVERYGPIFTPQANTVTTVATNLPVTEEPIPAADDFSTNAAGDFLALSVLAPNVPIPAFGDGRSGFAGYYPAPNEATAPAPGPTPLTAATENFGAQVLISADLEGASAGTTTPPPAPVVAPATGPAAAPTLPSIALPRLTIPVKNGTATVPIQCLLVSCAGVLNLQSAQLGGVASAARKKQATKPKLVSYGTASFSLKANTTGKVKVKLDLAGRKLLKAHGKVKAWANVRFTAGGGKPKSTRVTLKR
ncbi:MAG TPA: hypothetical protein VG188_08585 [Solirubrobacteraceae bacterium]|jgi:hypothetical protein|nr:hypothetical protein [Solirubrobacteraceae bacterium]